MVTQTIADSERFSIDFSFYKQRRVNFVVFLYSLCLSIIAKQRKKKKEHWKAECIQSVSVYIKICYYSVHQTNNRRYNFLSNWIAYVCLLVRSTGRKFSFQSTWDFLLEAKPRMPGANAPKAKHNLCQKNSWKKKEKPVLTLHFKVINQHLGTLKGGGIKYRVLKRPKWISLESCHVV